MITVYCDECNIFQYIEGDDDSPTYCPECGEYMY